MKCLLVLLFVAFVYGNSKSYGSYTYYLGNNATTFDDARSACLDMGAQLVVIHNEAIYNFLTGFIKNSKGKSNHFNVDDRDTHGGRRGHLHVVPKTL